ncbi:hypothetical protein ACIRPX_41200 [Streptomyces sp. NPDC101225]|uniref:hypothetical protein n=1 Tax=Streptomyces sp. NPDC101225 TaxID=3366135 RepID=UPI0037F47B1F
MTATMSFYADAGTRVRLNQYGTRRAPILALDGDDHSLQVSAFACVPVADHLSFARRLAAACADYVTALEAYAVSQAQDDRKPDEEA